MFLYIYNQLLVSSSN